MNTTLTRQYEQHAPLESHKLVSISELLQELKKRGVPVGRESELRQKLSHYSQKGAIPDGLSKSNPHGGMSDHYPLWVADIITDIDIWEKQGLTEQQVLEQLSSPVPTVTSANIQLNKIRRGGATVTGASQLSNVRSLVRAGIKTSNQ